MSNAGALVGSVSGGCVEEELLARFRAGELAEPFPTLVDFGVDREETGRLGLPCGGRLELLAATPCLTNLSVRAAGSAVRIDGGATPFPEGLTLSLAQGMVTELDFDGIADVDRLVLGGQAKSPGLYGGVDSEAPAKPSSAYFTGTGTLRVLNGPAAQGTVLVIQ